MKISECFKIVKLFSTAPWRGSGNLPLFHLPMILFCFGYSGLCCCLQDFSLVVASRGYSLVVVCGLLIAGASRCRAQAVGCAGFSTCSFQA